MTAGSTPGLPRIGDVVLIDLPYHRDDNGSLVVIEGGRQAPFEIARAFIVTAPDGAVRGQHAHKACAQLLTCPSGRIEVGCDDGEATATFVLDRPDVALLVPAGIWAEERYAAPGSVLAVFCDRPYEADDYLRDYEEFRAHRRAGGTA